MDLNWPRICGCGAGRGNLSLRLPLRAVRLRRDTTLIRTFDPAPADETDMSLISVASLGLTLADTLFGDLTLTLHPGDRLGLVAANGRGKTSLLRLLAGLAEPTQGTITRARGLKIGLVAQDPPAGGSFCGGAAGWGPMVLGAAGALRAGCAQQLREPRRSARR